MRVLTVSTERKDATSFYRGIGPLSRLKDVYIYEPPVVTWCEVVQSDLLFMQRPITPQHVQVIEMCQNAGLRVWVDYDDDIFSIPKSNPGYELFTESMFLNAVKILKAADVVTASTEFLAEKLKKYAKRVVVIPNAFDDYMFKMQDHVDEPKIAWRGGRSHDEDLISFQREFSEVSHENPDWHWRFYGGAPWFVENWFPKERVERVQSQDIIRFFRDLKKYQAKVHVVPLTDHDFNRSKSNIAWIEATMAGSVTLAPDWPEWRRPGVVNYKSISDFKEKITWAMRGNMDMLVRKSQNHIVAELKLSVVNKKRMELLEQYGNAKRRY